MTDASITTPDTRHRILTAAKLVFAQKGYHATRVSDIVQAAGVAQGTFYLYFKSKREAFTELVDSFFASLLEKTALATLRPREGNDPHEIIGQVRRVWHIALYHYREDRDLAYLILREMHGLGPDFERHVQAYYEHFADALTEYAKEGTRLGILRPVDPRLVAWAIVGMFERTVYRFVLVEGEMDVERMADHLLDIEMYGLLAAPD